MAQPAPSQHPINRLVASFLITLMIYFPTLAAIEFKAQENISILKTVKALKTKSVCCQVYITQPIHLWHWV